MFLVRHTATINVDFFFLFFKNRPPTPRPIQNGVISKWTSRADNNPPCHRNNDGGHCRLIYAPHHTWTPFISGSLLLARLCEGLFVANEEHGATPKEPCFFLPRCPLDMVVRRALKGGDDGKKHQWAFCLVVVATGGQVSPVTMYWPVDLGLSKYLLTMSLYLNKNL